MAYLVVSTRRIISGLRVSRASRCATICPAGQIKTDCPVVLIMALVANARFFNAVTYLFIWDFVITAGTVKSYFSFLGSLLVGL